MNEVLFLTKLFPLLKIVKQQDNLYSVYDGNKFIYWINTLMYDFSVPNNIAILKNNIMTRVSGEKNNYTTLVIVNNEDPETILTALKYSTPEIKLVVFNKNNDVINQNIIKFNIEVSPKQTLDETIKYYSVILYPTIINYIVLQTNMILSPTFFNSVFYSLSKQEVVLFQHYEIVNGTVTYLSYVSFVNYVICLTKKMYRRYASNIDFFQKEQKIKYSYSNDKVLLLDQDIDKMKGLGFSVKEKSIDKKYYEKKRDYELKFEQNQSIPELFFPVKDKKDIPNQIVNKNVSSSTGETINEKKKIKIGTNGKLISIGANGSTEILTLSLSDLLANRTRKEKLNILIGN